MLTSLCKLMILLLHKKKKYKQTNIIVQYTVVKEVKTK